MSGLIAGLQELIGKKIFRHEVEIDKTLLVRGAVTLKKGANLTPYRTGWINRSDWTNVHLGSNTTLNTDSNVTHNLNAPLSSLLVKLFVSTDGTDANSFEVWVGETGNTGRGITVYEIDNNNVKIQTGTGGFDYIDDAGAAAAIAAQNWYYQAEVYFLG